MSRLKCIKCEKPATIRYSPDLDIEGIGMCDEHEKEIKLDLLIAQFDSKGWEKFEKKYCNTKK
jgi:hypothetical protein